MKSNKFYRRIEFLGFSEIWKQIMDVTHLTHLTLFNRGVNSLGSNNELQTVFPNLEHLSMEINLISSWRQIFELSNQFSKIKILDLNFNSFKFDAELIESLNHFDQINSSNGI